VIVLESVSKTYPGGRGGTKALDTIDLTIGKNEFVVLRGPSGSGKTTLLVLIAGMLRPSRGEIKVDGERLSELSANQKAHFRAHNIGFIFQTFHLIPYLNVVENVALAAVEAEDASTSVEALLDRLGLGEKYRSLPAELSAGEKQRTAVARALINQPRIVLADEPTGNLDPDSARTVLSYLSDFHKQGGTVVVASHNDLADSFATRVVELEKGRISRVRNCR
jgi:ABC-type lipoprotein export system ATPase subunit